MYQALRNVHLVLVLTSFWTRPKKMTKVEEKVTHNDDNRENSRNASPISYPDPEAFTDDEALGTHLSRVLSQPRARGRLESLSRVLSTRTLKDGKLIINPEDFDLRVLLQSVRARMQSEGVGVNEFGVTFRNLIVKGVDVGSSYVPSVYEMIRDFVTLPMAVKKFRNSPLRNLIEGFDGMVLPGEMLLVLGRPGSGCSTLLKTISGEIDQFKAVEGEILYDGVSQSDMLKHFKKEIIYNAECK
jgi:ATP-binding cassette subfamily G (WHITE) protein 2 (SNQ2)